MNATIEEVRAVRTPEGSRRWRPLSHGAYVDMMDGALAKNNFEVVGKKYDLVRDGGRLFATYDILPPAKFRDCVPGSLGFMVAFGGGIDRALAKFGDFGHKVQVCSNGMITEEVLTSVRRKNTLNIVGQLPDMLDSMLQQFDNFMEQTAQQSLHLLETPVTDVVAHDTICKAVRTGAITGRDVANTINEWHDASSDWGDPTAWKLYNAFSAAQRDIFVKNPFVASQRTKRIESLFGDTFGNVNYEYGNKASKVALEDGETAMERLESSRV
jgi:hypothetical protein